MQGMDYLLNVFELFPIPGGGFGLLSKRLLSERRLDEWSLSERLFRGSLLNLLSQVSKSLVRGGGPKVC